MLAVQARAENFAQRIGRVLVYTALLLSSQELQSLQKIPQFLAIAEHCSPGHANLLDCGLIRDAGFWFPMCRISCLGFRAGKLQEHEATRVVNDFQAGTVSFPPSLPVCHTLFGSKLQKTVRVY